MFSRDEKNGNYFKLIGQRVGQTSQVSGKGEERGITSTCKRISKTLNIDRLKLKVQHLQSDVLSFCY